MNDCKLYKELSQSKLDTAFMNACFSGDLEKVKYLLTSPDLEHHANIHVNDDAGIGEACKTGHLPVVKYLMYSPDLKDHADHRASFHHALSCAIYNGKISNFSQKCLDKLVFN